MLSSFRGLSSDTAQGATRLGFGSLGSPLAQQQASVTLSSTEKQ